MSIALTAAGAGDYFKKLGFSGENITKISDSGYVDTIYVIGGNGNKSLPNAELAFNTDEDKVIFVENSTVQSINFNGGGSNDTLTLEAQPDSAFNVKVTNIGDGTVTGSVKVEGTNSNDSFEVGKINKNVVTGNSGNDFGTVDVTLCEGDDSVTIGTIDTDATLIINDVGNGKDTITVNSILGTATFIATTDHDIQEHRIYASVGKGGKAILQSDYGILTGGSGTNLNVRMDNSSEFAVATTDDNAIELKNATVEGEVYVKGSFKSDTFHISEIDGGSSVTLGGGGGSAGDTYQFDNIDEDASVTIESLKSWASFSDESGNPVDTLVIGGSLGNSTDAVKFNSENNTLTIGESKITVNREPGSSSDIYVNLASDKGTQVYRINKNGAVTEEAAGSETQHEEDDGKNGLIKDWSKLTPEKGEGLTAKDGYAIFKTKAIDDTEGNLSGKEVNIGVYKMGDSGVYAFASSMKAADNKTNLIATGTGTVNGNNISDITLNLQSNAGTILGIDDTSNVQTVVGSSGKDEIYVVGGRAGSFDFSSGTDADTIKFVRESGVTVTEIKGTQIFLQSAKDNSALSLYVNNTSGNINFVGGASTDSLTVGTLAGKLVANLGAENDSVVIKGGNGTVSLTGEGGVDTYKFADDVKATITDFGLAKDSLGKTEATAGSGVDVIDIGDVALTDVKFSSGDKTIKVGNNITLQVAPTDGTTMVYAMLKSGTEPAKVYQIDATKASTPTGGQSGPVVESHLITDWSDLDTAKGAELGAGNGYKQFAVPTLTDADKKTVSNNSKVYIGVTADYAFASTQAINGDTSFIATGSGNIDNGKITGIRLKLNSGASEKLGISGEGVDYVEGSDGPDEVYVTGNASGTKFDFQAGTKANDTILFTQAATVKKIIADSSSQGGKVSLKAAGDVALDVNVTEAAVGNIEFVGGAKADKLTVNSVDDTLVADLGADNDSVNITSGGGKVTLTGGAGNDTYTLDQHVRATITDFGFVNKKKAEAVAGSGIDILNVTSISDSKDISLVSGGVQIGSVLLSTATSGTVVYANIAVNGAKAKVYAIDSSGATELVDPTPTPTPTPTPDPDPDPEESSDGSEDSTTEGSTTGGGGTTGGGSSSGGSSSGSGSSSGGSSSGGSGSGTGADTTSGGSGTDTTSGGIEPVTYETVSGASGTFDAGSVDGAAYVDLTAQTGDVVVKGAQSYDGTNDSEATVINTSGSVGDMTQKIENGNLVLTDASGKSVTIENVEPGSAIKVGSTDNPEVLVIGGTGSTAVSEGLAEAGYYMGASGENTAFDFSKTDKTVIDLSGASSLDGATYKYVKGVTGSEAGESLLISGADAVTLQAAGNDDTLFGAGAGNDTLVSASGKSTNFMLQTGNGEDVVQGFTFGTGANSDKILVNTGVTCDETIISAASGQVKIGENGADLILSASGQDTVAMSYNYGGNNPGVVLIDVSENGVEMAFNNNYNIVVGQGEKSTLVAATGDTVQATSDTMPAGIGWNSAYLVSNVGVVDASASEMTAVNGAKNSSDLVKAATGSNLNLIWVCGGIGANFSDQGNDTLVASGQGHDEIFVGAKMGNDMVQNVASNDKITFIDTKVSDFGGDINNILKVDSGTNTFTATFASGDKTTTIKGITNQSVGSTSNLTFHFDDVDYVWDGNKFNQVTNS